jgi:cellulose synthase/poly-beta-1,6-N-acetylglucosamine synthase-like glycosyltransferase
VADQPGPAGPFWNFFRRQPQIFQEMTAGIIAFIIVLIYALLIGSITAGWFRLRTDSPSVGKAATKLSVIIAARNESKNLPDLINDLHRQDYPKELFEVIVVDDHSTDQTYATCITHRDKLHFSSLRVLHHQLPGDPAGKKASIASAIQQASGDLIITTDADCRMGRSWLSAISACYEKHHAKMILGPVELYPVTTFFEKLQSLEFMSLIASAAGSAKCRFPILANGANLAYERGVFMELKGFGDNMNYASGDDVFIMFRIKETYGSAAIRFLKSQKAIVQTAPVKSFTEFASQRLRWVSKSRGFTDTAVILSAVAVYLMNLMTGAAFVAGFFNPDYFRYSAILLAVKCMIDLPVLLGIGGFYRHRNLLWLFPLLEILNVFYTVIIGLLGNVVSFTWKGRRQ